MLERVDRERTGDIDSGGQDEHEHEPAHEAPVPFAPGQDAAQLFGDHASIVAVGADDI